MQGSKPERAESKKSTVALKAERQSDATDDEVLREEETDSSSGAEAKGEGRTPSPDGEFDDDNKKDEAGRAHTGPM
jgi:hypothetical protein